jgi:twitching motility protein PilT
MNATSSSSYKDPWEPWLALAAERQLTDLHLSTIAPPYGRRDGKLAPLTGLTWNESILPDLLAASLKAEAKEQLLRNRALDLPRSLGPERFRINLFFERGQPAAAIRRLRPEIPDLAALQLPSAVNQLTDFPHGLVIITGATGSGKSTTLAALLHRLNSGRGGHIITIEEPIEYLHANHHALVHQREVGVDTLDFASGVREALREDPDTLLVGEMRDLATARTTLAASETGHLVFSTLHSGDACAALDRLISFFPANEHAAVTRQVADSLRAVLAQRLIPSPDGLVPVCELLLANAAVRNLIRSGQFAQLPSCLETGRAAGMLSENASLAAHVQAGRLSHAAARDASRDPRQLESLLRLPASHAAF